MHISSATITDALSYEEVCPLCLDHYTAADECLCVVCQAPSCPGCAETIDADGAVRCFACRPPSVTTPPSARGARGPLSLPRPIAWPPSAYAPPPLPFPITSSRRGARALTPHSVPAVFVGLAPAAATPMRSWLVQAKGALWLRVARLGRNTAAQVWLAQLPHYCQTLHSWYGASLQRVQRADFERLSRVRLQRLMTLPQRVRLLLAAPVTQLLLRPKAVVAARTDRPSLTSP